MRSLAVVLGFASACTRTVAPEPGAERDGPATAAHAASASESAQPKAPEPTTEGVAFTPLERGQAGTLAYFETHAEPARGPLPLIVAIHGLGDQPSSFAGLFTGLKAPLRFVFLQAPNPHGNGYSWFDYDPAMGADALAPALADASRRVHEALVVLAERFDSPRKPLVTGFSQGGMLSFAVATEYGGSIAAALPIGGRLPPALWPKDLKSAGQIPPVIAFHGSDDRVVPIDGARAPVAHLQKLGVKAELREYAKVGHRVSPAMRDQLYAEILAATLP